jgi:hypothetical protein
MGTYIKYAIESDDQECARLACGLVSDLSSYMLDRFEEYLEDFVPGLHKILTDSTVDRKMKLNAMHALGDIALN